MTVLLVVGLHKGATGRGRRQLPRHARRLPRAARLPPLPARAPVRPQAAARDEPLRDAARPVRARALGDQLHRPAVRERATRGAPRSASTRSPSDRLGVIMFLMIAFRLAWPAFAYSIEDDAEAKRTYSFVLTYLLFVCCWVSLALGALAPWIVKILAPSDPQFHRADEAVGAARVRVDGVRRLHRARDRDRPRAADAVQLGRHRRRRGREHRAQLRADPAATG